MATESIRELLIERIRELRKLKSETSMGSNYRNIEELEFLNMRIYHVVFGRSI